MAPQSFESWAENQPDMDDDFDDSGPAARRDPSNNRPPRFLIRGSVGSGGITDPISHAEGAALLGSAQ